MSQAKITGYLKRKLPLEFPVPPSQPPPKKNDEGSSRPLEFTTSPPHDQPPPQRNDESSSPPLEFPASPPQPPLQRNDERLESSSHIGINVADLPADPGLRTRIWDYHPNVRDQVRRAYLLKGPCQPHDHAFPYRKLGGKERRFNPDWFGAHADWLEYSIVKDAAFCLCCYLFKQEIGDQAGGDTFVCVGFRNWKKKERLQGHVGGVSSHHNQCWNQCQDLMSQDQHIDTILFRQSSEARRCYRIRLNAAIDCVRLLLRQTLAFRGHDEHEESLNHGNFLEVFQFLADHNEDIKAVSLKNAPENCKLTAPCIQKDIVNAAAIETINVIIDDIGDALFSVLIDESSDVSAKEQMAVALRYVDKKGHVIERFLGIEHVANTNALTLKATLEALFSRHGLSMSRLRGQGYDGASNMKGEFNGLKTLIMKENECAFYIHCFAHQLQLALVAVARNNDHIASLFMLLANVVNLVGASCKRRDMLRLKQSAAITEALLNNELQSGRGLNQETTLKRASDTRWSSHYNCLINFISMFSSVIDVLGIIAVDCSASDKRVEAGHLLDLIQSFDFVFSLHLMKTLLGFTNDLSQALQKKDQDIANAINLVDLSKQRLQQMRENGWDSFLDQISSFCSKYKIVVPNMDDRFLARGRPRRNSEDMTNLHHYRVELFYAVIDMQLQELNNRFNEANSELLLCVACLSPNDLFSAFDKQKLIRLAQFYPKNFSIKDIMVLEDQLEIYILDMRTRKEFSELKGIGALARKMVETKRHDTYPLVYLLVTLALILPVATATVERAFSAMKIVKNRLRNQMGDQWMNDSLIVYIEKDIFNGVDNEAIVQRFQSMKKRRGQL